MIITLLFSSQLETLLDEAKWEVPKIHFNFMFLNQFWSSAFRCHHRSILLQYLPYNLKYEDIFDLRHFLVHTIFLLLGIIIENLFCHPFCNSTEKRMSVRDRVSIISVDLDLIKDFVMQSKKLRMGWLA